MSTFLHIDQFQKFESAFQISPNFNFGRVRVPFSSLSQWYFSSSSWCYPGLAKFGVPNGLNQSFATKLPSATGSEICARKTRMDFRFAHLCKITLISEGTNTLNTSVSSSSSFTQPNIFKSSSPFLNFAIHVNPDSTYQMIPLFSLMRKTKTLDFFKPIYCLFEMCRMITWPDCTHDWLNRTRWQFSNSPSIFFLLTLSL